MNDVAPFERRCILPAWKSKQSCKMVFSGELWRIPAHKRGFASITESVKDYWPITYAGLRASKRPASGCCVNIEELER